MLRHPLVADRAQVFRRRSAEEQEDDTRSQRDRAANPHNGSETHPWIIGTTGDRRKPIREIQRHDGNYLRRLSATVGTLELRVDARLIDSRDEHGGCPPVVAFPFDPKNV